MKPSASDYLEDMLDAARRARRHVGDADEAAFVLNEMAVDATIRALEVLGEAAKQVPFEIREREPEIPWRQMAGMRDRVIHGYRTVDARVVWRTVRETLPEVETLLTNALARQPNLEGHPNAESG